MAFLLCVLSCVLCIVLLSCFPDLARFADLTLVMNVSQVWQTLWELYKKNTKSRGAIIQFRRHNLKNSFLFSRILLTGSVSSPNSRRHRLPCIIAAVDDQIKLKADFTIGYSNNEILVMSAYSHHIIINIQIKEKLLSNYRCLATPAPHHISFILPDRGLYTSNIRT